MAAMPMPSPPRASASGGQDVPGAGHFPWLMLAALVALAFNLRSPLTALAPVIGELRADLGIGPTVAGLLTSIPVLCFGLLAPAASLLIARTGVEGAVFLTAIGAALGTVLRVSDGLGGALAGTLLLGAALTVGNIVSLMVIARDFPQRMGAVTGLYTAALNIGTMLTSALTAPLAAWLGWRWALGSWVDLALLAILLWAWVALRGRTQSTYSVTAPAEQVLHSAGPSVWKRPLTWWLVLALSVHLFLYYSLTAWLPAYLAEADGMSATRAGLVASAFQILALIGSFGVPWLAGRFSLAAMLVTMGLLWLVTPLWMLLAPSQWPLWSLTGGIAQGGTFVVVFLLIMRNARDLDDNRRISAAVQGLGYSLAAAGPLVTGALHEAAGSWRIAFLVLAGLALAIVLAGAALRRRS